MNRRIIILGSMLAGLVAIYGGWRANRARSAAEFARLEIAGQQRAREAEIESLGQRLLAATNECAAMRAALEGPAVPADKTVDAQKPKQATPMLTPDKFSDLVRDMRERRTPEGQVRELAWREARLIETYDYLFQILGLDAAQRKRFQEIALHREEQNMDIRAVAYEHGITLASPELGRLWQQADADYRADQRELLGEVGYQKLQEYERTASIRDLMRTFIGTTTVAGSPLSTQQSEQLIQLFASASEEYRQGRTGYVTNVDWNKALESARPFLSEQQLKIILNHEPSDGMAGMAWMKFNRLLQLAQEADRVANAASSKK